MQRIMRCNGFGPFFALDSFKTCTSSTSLVVFSGSPNRFFEALTKVNGTKKSEKHLKKREESDVLHEGTQNIGLLGTRKPPTQTHN